MKGKFQSMYEDAVSWAADLLNVKRSAIRDWVANAKANSMENGSGLARYHAQHHRGCVRLRVPVAGVHVHVALCNKPLFLDFISRLFPRDRHEVVGTCCCRPGHWSRATWSVSARSPAIVATLDSVALLIIGIDYAILFGVIRRLAEPDTLHRRPGGHLRLPMPWRSRRRALPPRCLSLGAFHLQFIA